jgi:hypothetical protein
MTLRKPEDPVTWEWKHKIALPLENSLSKRAWTCRETDYLMMMIIIII